jgi:hypothetical protein
MIDSGWLEGLRLQPLMFTIVKWICLKKARFDMQINDASDVKTKGYDAATELLVTLNSSSVRICAQTKSNVGKCIDNLNKLL